MNKKLRLKIIERFGSQAEFSMAVGQDESTISRVIRGRRKLMPEQKKHWADALSCKPKDVFPDEDENSN